MTKMPERPQGTSLGSPASTKSDNSDITSVDLYKKVSYGNHTKHKCTYYSCLLLGQQIINQRFIDLQNILIIENSRLIFDPFTEKVPGF